MLLWSAWTVLFAEFLSRRDLSETFSWALFHLPAFLLNSCLTAAALLLLTGLTGRPRVCAWALTGVTAVLALISGVKLQMLGIPLVPWDFVLASEAQGWVGVGDVLTLTILLGSSAFLSLGYLLIHRLKGMAEGFGRNERLAFASAALLATALLYFDAPVSVQALFRVQPAPWDQAGNVRSNGFALSMLYNVHDLVDAQRGGTDDFALQALADQTDQADDPPVAPATLASKPNIIVVLSETFWDPTLMTGVTFSRDPIPFFRSLQTEYPSGWMLSPEFAGSTANVEFEILTGLSMQFLPDGVLVYNQFTDQPIDSLASILARQGYEATMVSPWAYNFYNSDRAYSNFGFHKFISQEFIRPVYSGPNIADSEVARVIMDVTAQSVGPDFVFANTAENHYAYTPEKFPENTIHVTGLSGESKDFLETYAQGCENADKMLKMLVEHYRSLDEPTILVFFGDHLPLLGSDYSVYKEAGYITGVQDPDFLKKMYQVPVVVWNNYLPTEAEPIQMGTNFLGPYILNMAAVEGTAFSQYVGSLYDKVPAIPPQSHWQRMGISEADLKVYQALQHDILFGEQKSYGETKDRIANPDFLLGYGPMAVDRVSYALTGDEPVLMVKGRNFSPTAQIVLNGEPLPTTWKSYQEVTAALPAAWTGEGEATVEVQVRDKKKGTALSKSNERILAAAD